jgi:integrase
MIRTTSIETYQYSGALATLCERFIAEKRAVGYLYNTESKKLSEFSRFSESFDIPDETLTEEVVRAWIAKRTDETERNQFARFSLIKQFAEYMQRLGYSTFCPTSDDIGKYHKNYIPYIFSHDEIRRFFAVTDNMEKSRFSCAPRKHLIMPVVFRLLYCCGLRVSEALGLLGEDVDLRTGILTIRDSKFNKNRYVPMSNEMLCICINYAKTRLVASEGDDWFFAAPDGGVYHRQPVYETFRSALWKAGISHGGRGKGPRVHDFRHTFAVHCLQKWVSSGKDLTTVLPRLSAYLGHNGLQATEQYLRMTAEVYPKISAILQENYSSIFPKGGVD